MPRHPIRFGIQTAQQSVAWADLLDMWRKADSWGYDSLWLFDHFYPALGDIAGPCFEGWTAIGALAQATSRARIGHLVNGNTYRNPCVLAKMAATVDHISGGRLNLGLGTGWFEPEHRSFGIDFKTMRGRLEALDEACQIVRSMFTEERTNLAGKHYTVRDAMCVPKPHQQPHPPIVIGGTGRKILLRIVARHADIWNATGSVEQMREWIEVLRRHGDAVGRDTELIEKQVMMPLCYHAPAERQDIMEAVVAASRQISRADARQQMMIGDRHECLATLERYVVAGVTHFIFVMFPPFFPDEIQAFAEEVMPAVRDASNLADLASGT